MSSCAEGVNVQLRGEHPARKGRSQKPLLRMPHPDFNPKLFKPVQH
jgi:hypothetical protein